MSDTAPGAGQKTRVLVVDDSPMQRAMLVSMLAADPEIEVVGSVSDGPQAQRAVARLHPDVVTLDLHMEGMDGLQVTERIMQETPTPIVIVTSSSSVHDPSMVFRVLEAGALAIVGKPAAGKGRAGEIEELRRTVKSMGKVRVIRRWAPERLRQQSPPSVRPAPVPSAPPRIVAIGASTGGPQVIHAILTSLPADFPLPVVIVQHIAEGFAESMVDWLRPQLALPIQLASANVSLAHGGIYLAPTGRHIVVHNHTLAFTDEPPVSGHRPSATVLFRSVAREYAGSGIGILLTGMGDDGAVGLLAMKQAGGLTIVQDRATSVVFGMPGSAVNLGAADLIVPPIRIAPLLADAAQNGRRPST